jgi:hypothetical protein
MQIQIEYSSLKFFVQFAVEALALLVIAAYSASSLRRGRWAILGTTGGVLAGGAAMLLSLGWALLEFLDSNAVFDWITAHSSVSFIVDWAPPAGLVLICAAFVARGGAQGSQ